MRNVGLIIVGLIAGLAIGYLAFKSGSQTVADDAGGGTPAAAAAESKVTFKIAGTVPSSLIQVGTLGARLPDTVATLSGGSIEMKFFDPGALVPPLEIFDAVSSGGVDAGWGTAGYWAGKVPSLVFFSAIPFGPPIGEYMAWFYFGGGQEFYDEIYGRHNIKGVLCGIVSAEASGWFRKEINSLDDLKGLKMRFFGLGGRVMQKLGVSTQLLAGGDIYPALELGTIDATCGENFRHSIAEGEALQFKAIKDLQDAGVTVHKWPDEMLAEFERAWDEVVAEEVAADEDFARVWESLEKFRTDYTLWRELGYL